VTVFGLLLAAGSSTRFREGNPDVGNKLFEKLPDGREVWRAAFDSIAKHPKVTAVGVVGPADLAGFDKVGAFVVTGGNTRAESCLIGLRAAPEGSLVIVHDAARPFATGALVDRVIEAAERFGAAVPVTPVTDTIKSVRSDFVDSTVERSTLYRAQTPQAGRREDLIDALVAFPEATDEASALEAAGHRVRVVPGEESNVKITTMGDIPSRPRTPSVGFGFDIHSFSSDRSRPLVLGGVRFEGDRGLEGHSDADVVLHALTDALLGSVGEGDIGHIFPNDNPEYAGADSLVFLQDAVRRVRSAGGEISNADITVLAESPKLGEKREEIRQRISQELGVAQRRVNIKATTMEGLGAIGRNEGIAAMATVTVLLS
jgi:2-C-methyl-D-erythritol 4-phosphate cytidylyltransferase/2-C-methyl-D-erythritol 2,4-cyclodiphosphate synthase